MAPSNDTAGVRGQTLLDQARLLVERSRLVREAARVARQRAGDLRAAAGGAADPRELDGRGSPVPQNPGIEGVNEHRHTRPAHPRRRESDRRLPVAESRRILLVGPDEAWRLLSAYVFEEAGYSVYAAADACQALAFTTRLLPDVILVQMDAPDTLDVLAGLSRASGVSDIPVVVLTSSLESTEARPIRAAGGVTLLPQPTDVDLLVGEVDALIAVAPRAQRTLKRRLLDLQGLARYYTPDAEGQARLRRLIDRLQVAILAVDEQGRCIAASEGVTTLTGYSRLQLLTTSVFQAGFSGGQISDEGWRGFLTDRHYAGTARITNRAGEDVMVYAAAVAEIMPGFHVAAFVAA
ncbi:MAG: PAS domain S-box protein [Luteitalea sp.]|nr:PAS domain S-box protein [Luteitalea sp.]